MKIFKSMNLVAASLGSTLKKFKQKYSNSITLAVVTINKDIDVVAKMAQKKSQGEAFPGFDGVYTITNKINLKAGKRFIVGLKNTSPLFEAPYMYFYDPEMDSWGIFYANEYKKLVSASDISKSTFETVLEDKKNEEKIRKAEIDSRYYDNLKGIVKKFKGKLSAKVLKIEERDDGTRLTMGIDSFQMPGVPSVTIYSFDRGYDGEETGGIKEISFSSGRCSNKKELANFVSALDDIKNNWDVWSQYLIEAGKAKADYFTELRPTKK